ncbi:hypothetical protein KY289_038053 [Solanum tuberosum]|nr:hypothetical protein KY289_038053 [Solanum tuberosum]
MSMRWLITILAIATLFSSQLAYAYDVNPLQDICVAVQDFNTSVFVNGKFCKDPNLAKVDDFFTSGLNESGKVVRQMYGYSVHIVDVNNMPGLNTLGISIIRADFEPKGLIPLHTHSRATELITILKGTLYAGFLLPYENNFFKSRLFSKILNPGDVFVIPQGLIHFQYNVGRTNATILATYNSQNPGFTMIPNIIFASDPPIIDDALAKVTFGLLSSFGSSFDPNPFQDFCVAATDSNTAVFVNGKFCKDPKLATADDFFVTGLNVSGNPLPGLGSFVNLVDINRLAGLNTLGISLIRIDFAPYGLIPPHTHPRGTEIIVVLEGTLYVGFLAPDTSNPLKTKSFTKILNKGDVFVFPQGLIHFQYNIGDTNAIVFGALNSQNAGLIVVGSELFGTNPPLVDDVLSKAFQLDKKMVKQLQGLFS